MAVTDHTGGVARGSGLDVPALDDWVSQHGGVKGFPGGGAFPNTEIIGWDADVLVPAALEGAIHQGSAADVKASIIVEGANGPTTPEADAILNQRGVLIIPDILANAGLGAAVRETPQHFRLDSARLFLLGNLSRAGARLAFAAHCVRQRRAMGFLSPGDVVDAFITGLGRQRWEVRP